MPWIKVLTFFKFAHHGYDVEEFEPTEEGKDRETTPECADLAIAEGWALHGKSPEERAADAAAELASREAAELAQRQADERAAADAAAKAEREAAELAQRQADERAAADAAAKAEREAAELAQRQAEELAAAGALAGAVVQRPDGADAGLQTSGASADGDLLSPIAGKANVAAPENKDAASQRKAKASRG